MTVPQGWTCLTSDEKRERLLAAAEDLFARDGVGATMPAVAAAAGAGVGSLYRQFASKEELVAALARKRMHHVEAELDAALLLPDAWDGLQQFLWRVLEPYACDDLITHAIATLHDAELDAVKSQVSGKVEQLLAAGRDQGAVRPDITHRDIHIVVVGARAARVVEPEAWRRMIELALHGLRGS